MGHPTTKHPAVVEDLTARQVANIRANGARETSRVFNRVTKCALGEEDMSSQELKAADMHLKKTMPDLSAMLVDTSRGEFDGLSREELAERAAGLIAQNPALAAMTELIGAIGVQNLVAENPEQEEIEEAEVIPIKD